MMPLDEKDLQLLAEVLPNVSAQLRSSMANVFAAANRSSRRRKRVRPTLCWIKMQPFSR